MVMSLGESEIELSVCAYNMKAMKHGQALTRKITSTLNSHHEQSVEKTIVSCTKKITQLGRAGQLPKALKLFEEMPHRNQVSWNAMLTVLLESNQLDEARRLFQRMPQRNATSYTLIISNLSRSGYVSEASEAFNSIPVCEQNVFSWTSMISCYTHNQQHVDALKLFSICYGDFFAVKIIPNSYTFSILLKACSCMQSLVTAMQVHGLIVKLLDEEMKDNVFVLNSLIDVHTKFGSLVDAEKIFNGLVPKDLSSWNIMMAGYARNFLIDKALRIFNSMGERDTLSWNIVISTFVESGRGVEALELFLQLFSSRRKQVEPNPSTFTIVLTICATYTMLDFGTQIHACILKCGLLQSNVYTSNSLINMYTKCGSIDESERLFTDMPKKDVVSWNSLILGLGQNGCSRKAVEVAERALNMGIYNHNTFVALLTSCSHGGLVDEGMEYFGSMIRNYGVSPTLDHYNCVIDMFGRAGRISEACDLLCKMPFTPNAVTWSALLSASLLHGHKEIGELAAAEHWSLEPRNAASYVILANIYSSAGQVDKSRQIFGLMNKIGLKKEQACSWIP